MQVKFTTTGPMDFNTYRYVVVFNTSGLREGSGANQMEPYAQNGNPSNNGAGAYLNYSFAIAVGGAGGSVTAQAIQYVPQQSSNGGTVKYPYPLVLPPQNLLLTLNSNGQQTQFTVLFPRTIFSGIFGNTSGATPNPASSAQPLARVWFVNWITVDQSGNAVYQPYGVQSPVFPGYSVDTQVQSSSPVFNEPNPPQAPSSAAQFFSGQVDNSP